METKVCSSCKMEKPIAEFHTYGKNGSRIGKWCEACYEKSAGRSPLVPGKARKPT